MILFFFALSFANSASVIYFAVSEQAKYGCKPEPVSVCYTVNIHTYTYFPQINLPCDLCGSLSCKIKPVTSSKQYKLGH